jgi:hypothetical protein
MTAITLFDTTPAPTQINAALAPVKLSTAMGVTKNRDGTEAVGTAMGLVYTVGTAGGQLPKLKTRFGSTAGAQATGTTTASVMRIWANNGSVNTTATNNYLLGEVSIPATLMKETDAVVQPSDFDFGLLSLPAGYKIYAGLATAIGGTACALDVSMLGGGDFT